MTAALDGVAVVFVNHYSEALIAPKLAPLVEAGAEPTVVDNSGTFPPAAGVRVLSPGANVGFARGCNLALAAIGSDRATVCFQNPDLDATPGAVARLRDRLQQQRRPGLVAPALRTGSVVRRNGYHYPSPSREVVVGLRAIAAMRPGAGSGRVGGGDRPPARAHRPVGDLLGRGRRFGSGGLLVASRPALAAVGGFDEEYFLYAEDLDLWHRVGERGYDTTIDATVVVDHDEASGGRMAAADREILRWLGVELFAERTGAGAWQAFRRAHRPLLPLVARRGATLAGPVRRAWDDGARPGDVQREMRALLAGARVGADAVSGG